jgi:hypothetical protein
MAASPDLSRLPPRGPRDLGVPNSTLQIDKIFTKAKFFVKSRHIKYLNALLIMCTTF